jgi:hypothetical protein
MHYPCNKIFERGLLNTFEVAESIFDSQKNARNIEQGFAPGHKNVHFVREEYEQYQQPACPNNAEAPTEFNKAIEGDGEFKKVALPSRVRDKTVCLGIEMSLEE